MQNLAHNTPTGANRSQIRHVHLCDQGVWVDLWFKLIRPKPNRNGRYWPCHGLPQLDCIFLVNFYIIPNRLANICNMWTKTPTSWCLLQHLPRIFCSKGTDETVRSPVGKRPALRQAFEAPFPEISEVFVQPQRRRSGPAGSRNQQRVQAPSGPVELLLFKAEAKLVMSATKMMWEKTLSGEDGGTLCWAQRLDFKPPFRKPCEIWRKKTPLKSAVLYFSDFHHPIFFFENRSRVDFPTYFWWAFGHLQTSPAAGFSSTPRSPGSLRHDAASRSRRTTSPTPAGGPRPVARCAKSDVFGAFFVGTKTQKPKKIFITEKKTIYIYIHVFVSLFLCLFVFLHLFVFNMSLKQPCFLFFHPAAKLKHFSNFCWNFDQPLAPHLKGKGSWLKVFPKGVIPLTICENFTKLISWNWTGKLSQKRHGCMTSPKK